MRWPERLPDSSDFLRITFRGSAPMNSIQWQPLGELNRTKAEREVVLDTPYLFVYHLMNRELLIMWVHKDLVE